MKQNVKAFHKCKRQTPSSLTYTHDQPHSHHRCPFHKLSHTLKSPLPLHHKNMFHDNLLPITHISLFHLHIPHSLHACSYTSQNSSPIVSSHTHTQTHNPPFPILHKQATSPHTHTQFALLLSSLHTYTHPTSHRFISPYPPTQNTSTLLFLIHPCSLQPKRSPFKHTGIRPDHCSMSSRALAHKPHSFLTIDIPLHTPS